MVTDFESSDSGSVNSGQSYGWPTTTEQYDRIHLEVARSRTVAPRMTPMITEIVKSYETMALTKRTPPVPPPKPITPKPYIALRKAFFNNNIININETREKVSVGFNVEKTQVVERADLEMLTSAEEQANPTSVRSEELGNEKPEIVGAILKNVNDLHTECLARDENDLSDENGNCVDSHNESLEEIDVDNWNMSIDNEDEVNNNPDHNDSFLKSITEALERPESDLKSPPRPSPGYFRLDSLAEVINSVKIDITPTKMLLSMLPESNISSKYNLDSENMSIIYSLTPTNESDDVAIKKKVKRMESCNTEDRSVHDEESDYMWVDLVTSETKQDGFGSNETIDLLDSSMESLNNVSDQGSDILELPYSTVKELRETEGASFNRDIRSVANQIIADLGDIEMYAKASNFVDEILYDISCLKLDRNYSEKELSDVVQEKLEALGVAKDIANRLVSDLPCYEHKDAPSSNDEVIVVQEIVHHVIDNLASSESSPDSYNWKRVKESTNSELKEMQDSMKIEDEECENPHERNKSSDERLFITLDSFSPTDRSHEDDDESRNCECSESPLDCDKCDVEGLKRFQFVFVGDTEAFNRSKSSDDDVESDLTDQDTLGEAILQFCSIAEPCCTAESMALNFSVIKSDPREDLGSRCTCCGGYDSPNHLPPIDEANESLDNSAFPKSPKTLKSPSVLSLDYLSCKEDSHSTAFQSFQNTNENSPQNCAKDSDVEVVDVADKEQNMDGTYTVSDSSMNSMDSVSSIESDDPKRSQNPNDVTYSADISTNMDDTVFERKETRSSSSSDARLSDDNCFDTTTNMADVSAFNPSNDSSVQNFMAYSYDTNEFMKLEEALARSEEPDILSPIDPPPKYEDTTLYRVVSRINLADMIDEDEAAASDAEKC